MAVLYDILVTNWLPFYPEYHVSAAVTFDITTAIHSTKSSFMVLAA